MKPLCLYHADCQDGLAAAWAVRKALGADGADFKAVEYNTPPPDVAGRDVIIVDFSYKRPVIDEMRKTARSILILDHHQSAAADLASFPTVNTNGYNREIMIEDGTPVAVLFDMTRSGAGIAWDFFHPGRLRPLFIDYVEARDLWTKKFSDVDEFTFAVRSYPADFVVWDDLMRRSVHSLVKEGIACKRYHGEVVEALKRNVSLAYLHHPKDGVMFPAGNIVNAPKLFASELAGEIALPDSFGACFYQKADGRWEYSLRSRSDCDVSRIAHDFGGGGHARAAGFVVPDLVHKAVG